jgi:RHS repeat-associated protein
MGNRWGRTDGDRRDGTFSETTALQLFWRAQFLISPSPGDPMAESDASGNLTNEYIFLSGARIAMLQLSSGNVNYYVADHLGSSHVVTNSSGTILDDSDFYPYGGERSYASSSGNTRKFTGKERDSESGLDDFAARFYTSNYGRFLSPDESKYAIASDPQSWNLYGYVANNPINSVDPTGHAPESFGRHEPLPMDHGSGSLDGGASSGFSQESSVNSGTGSSGDLYGVDQMIDGVFQPREIVRAASANDAIAQVIASSAVSPEAPPSSCSATLRFRSLGPGTPTIADGATHSFWQIHDSHGDDYTLSGFPEHPDGPDFGWLQVFAPKGLQSTDGKDNSSATIHWTTRGTGQGTCAQIDAMRDVAKHFPNSGIVYNPVLGPNSNSVAHMLGSVGGFAITKPPGAVGWDTEIPRPH